MDATTWNIEKPGTAKTVIPFGVKDSKGREIGAHVEIFNGHDGLRLLVQSTRDGKKFGAYPGSKRVVSLEAGQQEGLEKAAEARVRMRKDAAKTGGTYLTAGERKRR